MPRKCCVPYCKTNYTTTGEKSISTFKFPKDQTLRRKWLSNIKRPDLVITKHTSVCINHFEKSQLTFVSKTKKPDRKKQYVRELKNCKPIATAIPTIFNDFPLSCQPKQCPTSSRTDYSERKKQHVDGVNQRLLEQFEECDLLRKDFNFASFNFLEFSSEEQFFTFFKNPISEEIYISLFAKSTFVPVLEKCIVLKWDSDHQGFLVDIQCAKMKVPRSHYSHLLEKGILRRQSQLTNMVSFLKNTSMESSRSSIQTCVLETLLFCSQQLESSSDATDDDNIRGKDETLPFLIEQLQLWTKAPSKRRWVLYILFSDTVIKNGLFKLLTPRLFILHQKVATPPPHPFIWTPRIIGTPLYLDPRLFIF